MFRCRTPSPPDRAIAMAISRSVTVSIAAERTGTLRSTDRETRVDVSASSGSTRLSIGRSSTSSKVNATGTSSFRWKRDSASFAMSTGCHPRPKALRAAPPAGTRGTPTDRRGNRAEFVNSRHARLIHRSRPEGRMAPAMSTPARIAVERAVRSGETFTRSFGWTKPKGGFRFGGAATARYPSRARHHRSVDGDGRPV